MTEEQKDKICVKAGGELYKALVDISAKYNMSGGMAIGAINAMVLYIFKMLGHKDGRKALREMHELQLAIFDNYDVKEKKTDA